jgi:hypothetical protein
MADKRQIRGEQYNVAELVQNAMNGAQNVTGADRDKAILRNLAQATGAWGFAGQFGKIRFDNVVHAVADVNAYLSRRNAANHSRWTKRQNRF